MGYLYAAVWLAVAVLLIVRFRKESRIIYFLSGYFVIMSGWWFANELVEVDLLSGTYGWIFRIISAVVIIALLILYFRERQVSPKSPHS